MFPWGGNDFFPWPRKTPQSGWMYPPKNVGLGEYMQTASQHKFNTLKRYRFYAVIGIPMYFIATYVTGSMWMNQMKNGGKFYVDLMHDEGSKLMGPPCPKALAERELNRVVHAEHM